MNVEEILYNKITENIKQFIMVILKNILIKKKIRLFLQYLETKGRALGPERPYDRTFQEKFLIIFLFIVISCCKYYFNLL